MPLGAELWFTVKYNFSNSSTKSGLNLDLGISSVVSDIFSLNGSISNKARSTNDSGTISIQAFQLGGDSNLLASALGGDSSTGIAPIVSCKLQNLDSCNKVITQLLNYASSSFVNQVSSYSANNPYGLAVIAKDLYENNSFRRQYSSIMPDAPAIAPIGMTADVRASLADLSSKIDGQYADSAKLDGVYTRFNGSLPIQISAYLDKAQNTIYSNIVNMKNAGYACLEDPSSCAIPYSNSISTLQAYDKTLMTPPYVLREGGVCYQSHLSDIGWGSWTCDQTITGTTGQGRRLEAIKIFAKSPVCYSAHLGGIGWQPEVCDGDLAGTTGQARPIEAIKIRMKYQGTGKICYQAHVAINGWLAPVCDGNIAGTTGQGKQMEALKIWVE